MLNSIQLQNFQAHEDTLLELHPGVNVIAGSSNSGKSSILRALNWVTYNRPTGEAFLSHWARDKKGNQADDVSVTLTMGEQEIVRRKSKVTKNTYSIGDKTLEAIGMDVPEEVAISLNLSDVNIQRQHDSPFLLSESPGEVARFFNKIVHFDAIDKYLSTIESKKRKTKADVEMCKENVKRLDAKIPQYDWVQDAERLLEKIHATETELLSIHDAELIQQTREHTAMTGSLQTLKEVIAKSTKLCTVIDAKLPKISEHTTKYENLLESLGGYNRYNALLQNGVETTYADKLLRKIERMSPLVADMTGQCTTAQSSIDQYKASAIAYQKAKEEIASLEASLPSVCPTCGKEL